MQQRRLRLGDILDDYCPRERRITNHAVVAMIDEQVKQTRCTTCDADHDYKEGRLPSPRRKKDANALAEGPDGGPRAVRPVAESSASPTALALDEESELPDLADGEEAEPLADAMALAEVVADDDEPAGVLGDDDGPVHRPLIRAVLPRPEGHVPERREPEFTVRQPGGGGRGFDGNRGGGHGGHGAPGGPGGQRPGRNRRQARAGGGPSNGSGPARFGGPRQGGNPRQGSGPGQQNGNRPTGPRGPGAGGEHRGPGRKRGR